MSPGGGNLARGVLAVGIVCVGSACDRAPRDVPCPPAAAGDLVITELHGAQSGSSDEGGQWIELANTTGGAIPLAGLQLLLSELDESVEFELFVRDAELEVAAGGRVVLGRRLTGDLLPHIDYGYGLDYEGELFDAGELTISSCGTLIDHVSWTQLPSTGSLALDGTNPPDAEANDLAEGWCDDATPFGSPGEDNPPCP